MERAVVSAATGAMSSVLAKLAELLHEKYKLAKGVRKDIEFLKSELSVMNDLLCVMEDVEELDPLNKGWRDRVRELAYDIEDRIDLSVAKLDHGNKGRVFTKLLKKLKKPIASLQIAHQIQELKARVVEESERHKRYKLEGLTGSTSDASRNKVDLRMCALWEETKNLVGLDGPMDEIIRFLMPANKGEEPSQQVKILSIVGCAGLGKTTLANQVYQKIQDKGDFKCKAFVSISQNPHMKDVLLKIGSQVEANVRKEDDDDEHRLISKLRQRLQNNRYIVVVDDIWHSDPWKIIGQALVKTSPGSIIIITTRLRDVAESCCSSHGGRVYDMRPLDNNDSRRLFLKRIFYSEDKCPHELERASEDILKKCDGIPLAIISISSFLADDVPQSPDHWNKVKESISSPHSGNKSVEAVKAVLSLSYFNLPQHLRTCLLYLSAFPEDCIIDTDRLVCRWIAEGFVVNAEPGESLYEAGLRHFNVLINRSLIQPWREENGLVLSCRVHDVILNFLVSKSVEENFLTLLDPSGLPLSQHSKFRRLSLQNGYQVSWIKSIKPHVRSLACFVDCKELHPLTEFEVLRVVDLEGCGSLRNVHLANIEMLLHLRYLSIKGTSISELPAGIGKVQHLETLDIRDTEVKKLPSSIVLLEKLSRLFVSEEVQFPTEGFSNMKGLEQLTCFSTHRQSLSFLEELGHLTNLRTLAASFNGILDANHEGSRWRTFTSSLRALCRHKLVDVEIYRLDLTPIPMDPLFPSLQSLRTFSISPVSSFPIWMGSLVNLEVLHLRTQQFTPEDLRVLGSMPVLETLTLFLPYSYVGPFTIGRHEFQRLKLLKVDRLHRLLFMPGSMPNLKHLDIELAFTKNIYSDLGIQHLASLTKVDARIYAWRDHRVGVVDLEAKMRSLLDAHPNRPTVNFSTSFAEDD